MTAAYRTEATTVVRGRSSIGDSLRTLSEQVFKMLTKEHLNIVVKQVFYDTGYPVDSATCRPPVAEEREITIMRETQIDAADSLRINEMATRQTTTDVQSLIASKVSGETSEKTETGMNMFQKILMITGAISVIAIIIYLILKFK
jgi:hypothetical protein